jgi:2'-5' RNA ligase
VRSFVAAELPAPVRGALERAAAPARERFPPASWVRAANLHLTLAFLGELEPGRLPEVRSALSGALARQAPLAVRTAGIGAFPERGPLRVVWIALEPAAALAALAGAAREALRAIGVGFDAKRFSAHVTLARPRAPWPPALRARLAKLAPEPAGFELREVALLASRLEAAGSVYEPLARFALAETRS